MLQFITILLIAVGLAMDAFAVSLGVGTAGEIQSVRGKIRLAAHFGIFQAGMTALGWVIGGSIIGYIEHFDHWIAMALLGYVGIKLIRAGLQKDGQAFDQDPSTGRTLVVLSFATSIDAFAVGLSIALMGIPVLLTVAAIGAVTFALSILGLFFGVRLSEKFGQRMEIAGGIILIAIGLRIVFTHLFP